MEDLGRLVLLAHLVADVKGGVEICVGTGTGLDRALRGLSRYSRPLCYSSREVRSAPSSLHQLRSEQSAEGRESRVPSASASRSRCNAAAMPPAPRALEHARKSESAAEGLMGKRRAASSAHTSSSEAGSSSSRRTRTSASVARLGSSGFALAADCRAHGPAPPPRAAVLAAVGAA